jgi:hypothetical protein
MGRGPRRLTISGWPGPVSGPQTQQEDAFLAEIGDLQRLQDLPFVPRNWLAFSAWSPIEPRAILLESWAHTLRIGQRCMLTLVLREMMQLDRILVEFVVYDSPTFPQTRTL